MSTFKKFVLAASVVAASCLASALPAAAHVTVQPAEAEQGSYTKLTFRTPNESDTAATVKVEVELPAEVPSARTKPVPGWTATVDGTTIRWEGGRIEPGQFQEFEISVGPLPEVETLLFKTVQTYEDGLVVRWADEPVGGEEEPEHPAPTLSLVAGAETEGVAVEHTLVAAVDQDDVDSARTVGVVGIVVGALGVLLGLGALLAARRRSS